MNQLLRAVAVIERARLPFAPFAVQHEIDVIDAIERGIAGRSGVRGFDQYCRHALVLARYALNRVR